MIALRTLLIAGVFASFATASAAQPAVVESAPRFSERNGEGEAEVPLLVDAALDEHTREAG